MPKGINRLSIKIKFLILTVLIASTPFFVFNNSNTQSITHLITQANSVFSISDFSNFTINSDSEFILNENNGNNITYSYHGATSIYPLSDRYSYSLPNDRNFTDFNIEFTVQYNYTDQNDIGSFALYLKSNYNEIGELDTKSIGCIELWDGWSGVYGRYHVVGYPDNTLDSQPAAEGSMGKSGVVIFSAVRNDDNLTLAIKNNSTDESLISYSWLSGVSRPLNLITLKFHTGYLTSDIDVIISDMKGELVSPDPDIIAPELSIIYPINQSTILTSNLTVTWSGSDNDSGLLGYYIRIDSGDWIDVNTTTYYSFEDLIDGVHIIEVKAVDNELNEKICLISFTILTTTPTIESPGFTILLAISVLLSFIAFVTISLRFKTKK